MLWFNCAFNNRHPILPNTSLSLFGILQVVTCSNQQGPKQKHIVKVIVVLLQSLVILKLSHNFHRFKTWKQHLFYSYLPRVKVLIITNKVSNRFLISLQPQKTVLFLTIFRSRRKINYSWILKIHKNITWNFGKMFGKSREGFIFCRDATCSLQLFWKMNLLTRFFQGFAYFLGATSKT